METSLRRALPPFEQRDLNLNAARQDRGNAGLEHGSVHEVAHGTDIVQDSNAVLHSPCSASQDRNAGQRMRSLLEEEADIRWEPYPAQLRIQSTSAILGRKKGWIACYGATLSLAGTLIGACAVNSSSDTQTILQYAAAGGGIGAATAALLTCGIVFEERARQAKLVRELGGNINNLPYSKRALPGGKAILNAPSLDEILRSRLAALFDGIACTPANGKIIAELLFILHGDPESDATAAFVERLAALADDMQAGRFISESAFMARIERALQDWKSMKTKEVTALVLYQGAKAAGIPAYAIEFEEAILAQGMGKVEAYLGLKSRDMAPPVIAGNQQRSALAFLGKWQRWKDHLEKQVPDYLGQQALVQNFVAEALSELETLYRELPDQAFMTGIAYLKRGHDGDFLARWYAEECLKEPGFIKSVDAEWVKSKLISEFNCPGLPESRILEIIDRLFAERKGTYARENVPVSQSEVTENKEQRQVNVSSLMAAADREAQLSRD